YFAVIVASPSFFAITLPFFVTLATAFLLLLHLIFESTPSTFNLTFCPLTRTTFLWLIFGVTVSALTFTAGEIFPMHKNAHRTNVVTIDRVRNLFVLIDTITFTSLSYFF